MNWWRRSGANRSQELHLAATWSIPPEFGGLPHAVLARTRLLAEAGLRPQILTFHSHDDLPGIRKDLHERGLLPETTPLRNMWEEIGALEETELQQWRLGTSYEDHQEEIHIADGNDVRNYTVLRHDGSPLATQAWIGDFSKSALDDRWGDRCLHTTLFNHHGDVLTQFAGAHLLQQAWLDHVIKQRSATIVADDAAVVDMVSGYHRPNVASAWVVHGNHLKRNRHAPIAGLSDWRKFLMERRADLDATVYLTEQQRHAVRILVPTSSREEVIGHAVDVGGPNPAARNNHQGVVVGRLVVGKRIDHAIEAMALVPHDNAAHLDIIGAGPERPALVELIRTTKTEDRVSLRGYVTDVAAEYAKAGFMVLASAQEAFGLVILEAMAAGCIPIAYNAPYGPADLIEDGVNGFLVPNGDRAALAQAIVTAAELDERRRRAMQKAAARTVAQRSPASVTKQWLALLNELKKARRGPMSTDVVVERELIAGRIRSERASVRSALTEALWIPDGSLELTVHTQLVAAGSLAGRTVDAELVNATTGSRAPLHILSSTLTDAEGVAALRISMAPEQLGDIQSKRDYVVLIGVGDPKIRYEDTIRTFFPQNPTEQLPLAVTTSTGTRVTLHRDRKVGLTLRRPQPRVIANAQLELDQIVIHPITREPLQAVRLTSGSTAIQGTATASSGWSITLPDAADSARTWTLEARDAKGWTKLAYSGHPVLPVATSQAQLRTTDYGYLRLEQAPARVKDPSGTDDTTATVD